MPSSLRRCRAAIVCCGFIAAFGVIAFHPAHGEPKQEQATAPAPNSDSIQTDTNSDLNRITAATRSVADAPEVDAESEKERLAAERFLDVLTKNPRRGTALERVYAFHVNQGSLSNWIQQYRDRVQRDPKDGNAWMLLGLIELQQGQDAAALQAFQNAEQFLPDNPLAAYYLGQSLMQAEQLDLAGAAFERALQKKPAAVDQLEIFQALGRLHQRAHNVEQALAVWKRLETLFPNDLRVQEQIAQTLVEEDQLELALPRYAALAAASTKDLYRQSQFRIQVAELKVQLGRTEDALRDFERLLTELNPDNWLYRDVRQKIEAVFLRNDDQARLSAYYEGWLKKHPDDVDAMARLARVLANQERRSESQAWLEKGLKLAPTRHDLRKVVIDQLLYHQNYAEAIQHYEILNRQTPNNPDTIREWGRLILKDTTQPLEGRQKSATDLWKQLLMAKPKDPVIVTQVADLFRQAELNDEALSLYLRAVELAPDAPQYREYLGEFYHQLKQPAKALETWREIASGIRRNAANVSRVGEVLSGFGYTAEGIAAFDEAVALDPQDFELRLRFAKVLYRNERYTEALQQLAGAETLVTNVDEAELVLQQKLLNLQAAQILSEQIASLVRELETVSSEATPNNEVDSKLADTQLAKTWYLLARYCEAGHRNADALRAVERAASLDPQSIPILAAAAKIQEANYNLAGAAQTNRRLATLDRRFRSEYLTRLAKLEGQLGQVESALKAGREVLAAAPGNPESYEFYAQLCFQLGAADEGFETLRRAVRLNPSNVKVLLTMADYLGEQPNAPEAIAFYWRAFDKSLELHDKLHVIKKLTEVSISANQFDRLLDRLERQYRSDPQQMRTAILCRAEAQHTAGDDVAARQELERLLTSDTRDTALLEQLGKVAAATGDYSAAIKYQRQLASIVPGKTSTLQLASYLTQAGETEEASALLTDATLAENDPVSLLKNVDWLLNHEQYAQVKILTAKILQQHPRDWEYLYRDGVALAASNPAAAEQRFREILAISIPEHEIGLLGRSRQQTTVNNVITNRTVLGMINISYFERLTTVYQVSTMLGLDTQYAGVIPQGGSPKASSFMPSAYKEARIAALGWMLKLTQSQGTQGIFLHSLRERWAQNQTSEQAGWDCLTAELLMVNGLAAQPDSDQYLEASRKLATLHSSSLEAQLAYLFCLTSFRDTRTRKTSKKSMIPDIDVDQVLKVYQEVRKHPEFAPIHESIEGVSLLHSICDQLREAKRYQEARRLYVDVLKSATALPHILNMMLIAQLHTSTESAWELWDRAEQLQRGQTLRAQASPAVYSNYLCWMMAVRAQAQIINEVIAITERYLTFEQNQRNVAAAATARLMPQANSSARSGIPPWPGSVSNPGTQQFNLHWLATGALRSSSREMTFPAPNSYYDADSIKILYHAYVLCNERRQLPLLIKHFETRATAADVPASDRLIWQLGGVYLLAWSDNLGAAIPAMKALCEQLPEDHELHLQLAELYINQKSWTEALQQLDAIRPVNSEILYQRENLALQAAVKLKNIARVKVAASHVMGRPLGAESQLKLAFQMIDLGLNADADILFRSVLRNQGSPIDSLSSLMQEFQTKKQPEMAAEVALILLRRTQANGASVAAGRPQTWSGQQTEQVRSEAMAFLARSGKLSQMIADLKTQLQSQPKSLLLNQTLIEYYTAAGDQESADKVLAQLAEWNLGDAETRWNLGVQYLRRGAIQEGKSILKSVVKHHPSMLRKNLPAFYKEFRNKQSSGAVATLLQDADLRLVGNPSIIGQITNDLLRNRETLNAGLGMLSRVWIAFPEERYQILLNNREKLVWKDPVILDYARQVLIPQSGNAPPEAWAGFEIALFRGEGKVSGLLNDMLQAAEDFNKLGELETQISQAIRDTPKWTAGPAWLGIVQLRRGNHTAGVQTLTALHKQEPLLIPYSAAWLIGQELGAIPEGRELAIGYYERSIQQRPHGRSQSEPSEQFQLQPEFCLVNLYMKLGQKEKAKQVLLNSMPAEPDEITVRFNRTDVVEANYRTIRQELIRIGAGMDALQTCYRSIGYRGSSRAGENDMNRRFPYNISGYSDSVRAIEPADFIAEIQARVESLAKDKSAEETPAIDLLSVGFFGTSEYVVRHLDVKFGCLLSGVLEKFGEDEKSYLAVDTFLDQLSANRRHDVSIPITRCLLALHANQSGAFAKSVERLDQWVTAHALKPRSERGSEPERESDDESDELGEPQLMLWLVGRECLRLPELQPVAHRLYRRVCDLARSRESYSILTNVCNEAGSIALDLKDKPQAAVYLADELDSILSRPSHRVEAKVPVDDSESSPAVDGPHATPLITSNDFNDIEILAKRAAVVGDFNLSLKAMRQALRDGPPLENDVKASKTQGINGGVIMGLSVRAGRVLNRQLLGSSLSNPLNSRVTYAVNSLVSLWAHWKVPPKDIYDTLLAIVVPEGPSQAVYLYPAKRELNQSQRPESIGLLLAKYAVLTDQVDLLRKRLQAQLQFSDCEYPARVMLALLAMEAQDVPGAQAALREISRHIEHFGPEEMTELFYHVIQPALEHDEYVLAIEPVLERIIPIMDSSGGAFKHVEVGRILVRVARQHYQLGQIEAGKAALNRFQQSQEVHYPDQDDDYNNFVSKRALFRVAQEFALVGQVDDALDKLGKSADYPEYPQFIEPSEAREGLATYRLLIARSAEERYQLLREWTFGKDDRTSIRIMDQFGPNDGSPALWIEKLLEILGVRPVQKSKILEQAAPLEIFNRARSAKLLVRAAIDADRLEELEAAVIPLAEKNVKRAGELLLLIRFSKPAPIVAP